jgi:hypothetical protein
MSTSAPEKRDVDTSGKKPAYVAVFTRDDGESADMEEVVAAVQANIRLADSQGKDLVFQIFLV